MRTIGIDFGTCNIKAAEKKRNGDIVSLKLGKRIDNTRIPNVILYEQKKEEGYTVVIGEVALKRPAPEQDKIRNIKSYLQEYNWTHELSFGKKVNAYEITCEIMKNIYQEIYASNKDADISAVITIPVNFSKRQQLIVKKAAEQAGFIVKAVITEPFAAFFSLMQENMEEEHNVLIFDFGGGTLDLCLVKVTQEDEIRIETQSTIGINYGGNQINEDMINHILRVKEPEKIADILDKEKNILHRAVNKNYLMKAMDETKEEFFQESNKTEELDKELLVELHGGKVEDLGIISVADIYEMLKSQNWKNRIKNLLNQLFFDSDDVTVDEVTDIFMIGGSSAISYFRKIIEDYFLVSGKKDIEELFELNDDLDSEERIYLSVAGGAAIYNELITSQTEEVKIKDRIPFMVYTKCKTGDKLTPLMKTNTFKDYCSRLDSLTEEMKQEKRIPVYQTIFGEMQEEVYLGDICLDDDIVRQASLYRLMVDKAGNILAEIGYLDTQGEYEDEEDRFCVDWRCNLEIKLTEIQNKEKESENNGGDE